MHPTSHYYPEGTDLTQFDGADNQDMAAAHTIWQESLSAIVDTFSRNRMGLCRADIQYLMDGIEEVLNGKFRDGDVTPSISGQLIRQAAERLSNV